MKDRAEKLTRGAVLGAEVPELTGLDTSRYSTQLILHDGERISSSIERRDTWTFPGLHCSATMISVDAYSASSFLISFVICKTPTTSDTGTLSIITTITLMAMRQALSLE